MPTNLDLDKSLVAEAMRLSGLRTKKSVVEEGLRALIRLHRQTDVRRLRGLLHWQDPEEGETKKGKGRSGAGSR